MQRSELLAAAGVLVFLIIVAWIICATVWRVRKLQHEERRLMIEKGMTPPPRFSGGWPQVRQAQIQARFEERRLMIEKGMVPPDQPGEGERWQRDDFLRRGAITCFMGIGLGVTYYLLPETADLRPLLAFLSPGLAMFGLGCLVYYWLSAQRSAVDAVK